MKKWKEKTLKEKLNYIGGILIQFIAVYLIVRTVISLVLNANACIEIALTSYGIAGKIAFIIVIFVIAYFTDNWLEAIELSRASKTHEAIYWMIANVFVMLNIVIKMNIVLFILAWISVLIVQFKISLHNDIKRTSSVRIVLITFFITYSTVLLSISG